MSPVMDFLQQFFPPDNNSPKLPPPPVLLHGPAAGEMLRAAYDEWATDGMRILALGEDWWTHLTPKGQVDLLNEAAIEGWLLLDFGDRIPSADVLRGILRAMTGYAKPFTPSRTGEGELLCNLDRCQVICAVNDLDKVRNLMLGLWHSRYTHVVFCEKPAPKAKPKGPEEPVEHSWEIIRLADEQTAKLTHEAVSQRFGGGVGDFLVGKRVDGSWAVWIQNDAMEIASNVVDNIRDFARDFTRAVDLLRPFTLTERERHTLRCVLGHAYIHLDDINITHEAINHPGKIRVGKVITNPLTDADLAKLERFVTKPNKLPSGGEYPDFD